MNEGKHTIRISPSRFPADPHKQGNVLRHETEHVIQGCSWEYKAWALGQLTFITTSAIGSGALFAYQISHATESLPEPVRTTLGSIGALGGAAMGALISSGYGKLLNPLELGATIAERKYAKQLADGTLVVN